MTIPSHEPTRLRAHTATVLLCAAAIVLSGCNTMPTAPASAPAPAPAPTTATLGCKPVYGPAPTKAEATAGGAVLGAILGAAIGSATAGRNSGRATRNGALLGALTGALAGSAYASQMSATEEADGSIKLSIPGKVLFGFDSAEVSTGFRSTLEQVAKTINEYCDVNARVVGHTDNVGQISYNEALSLRRAGAVANVLRGLGVSRQIMVEGAGPHRPVSPNTTEDARAANRRVEVFLLPPPRS